MRSNSSPFWGPLQYSERGGTDRIRTLNETDSDREYRSRFTPFRNGPLFGEGDRGDPILRPCDRRRRIVFPHRRHWPEFAERPRGAPTATLSQGAVGSNRPEAAKAVCDALMADAGLPPPHAQLFDGVGDLACV